MSELEDFLARTLQRHAQATTGVRNGDATAIIEMLSTRDPVTLFPAAQPAKRGWAEVSQAFQRVASLYSKRHAGHLRPRRRRRQRRPRLRGRL